MTDAGPLTLLFPYLATVLGLILGSFHALCVRRSLAALGAAAPDGDALPLLGWLLKRARGRAARVAPLSLAIETASALWALGLALEYGPGAAWLVYMALGGVFIVASFIDLKEYVLPDALTYPAVVLALAGRVLVLGDPVAGPLLGAVCGPLLFWLLATGYRRLRGVEGLGLGDVKLMAGIGALVGWRGLPLAIVLASAAALLASPFLAREGADKRRAPIPFGPFLCLGAMLYVLYGHRLLGLAS